MFTHLNIKTEYSMLNSIAKIDGLIEKAKRNNMKALAITDINNMHIVYNFEEKCKKAGLKPILGVNLVVKYDNNYKLLGLLAKNEQGYKKITKIVTETNVGEKSFPYIEFNNLKKIKSNDIYCMTGGVSGQLNSLVSSGLFYDADKLLDEYTNIFGKNNVIIEISLHGIQSEKDFINSNWLQSKILNDGYMYVATNDIYYLNKEHALHRSIGLSMNPNPDGIDEYSNYVDYNSEFYFKTEKEMEKVFSAYLHKYPDLLTNSEKIVNQCNAQVPVERALPEFPLPNGFSSEQYLYKLVWEGFKEKFPNESAIDNRFTLEDYKERLEHEFDTIVKMGFVDYFLIVQDFINWSKDTEVYKHPEVYFPHIELSKVSKMCIEKNFEIKVGPGRGSAAGSLLAYCLKITNLDPMKYDLLFERFLNPERVSMPDVDIDFSNRDREKVVEYVQNKYGYSHVAQIVTFQKLKLKSIIKKVAKSYGIPYSKTDEMTKMIPGKICVSTEKEDGTIEIVEKEPELLCEIENIDYFSNLINKDDDIKLVFKMGKVLEGLPSTTGKHAAGVIIGRQPLQSYLPLMEVDGVLVTQFEKKASESIGLLKMDFLGLQTLDIIQETEELVKENYNQIIHINDISIEDEKTFEIFQKGNTGRVFQFEGAGMKNLLKQMHPTSLEHLNAACALYRPGPMDYIPNYIEGRKFPNKIDYPHELFKEVAEETFGILVYQEQIMQLVQKMAGFSLGEADILRRGISKKEKDYLDKARKQFVDGCKKINVAEETSSKIYDTIELFAEYGFNKSHSCAYSYVSYQTGWLKAHFPEAFMAANLTVAAQNKDKVAAILSECKKMQIEVLPPDINKSEDKFTLENKNGKMCIRFGFNAIQDVGEQFAKQCSRKNKKSLTSFQEFLNELNISQLRKDTLTFMINSGAFDNYGTRLALNKELENLLEYEKAKKRINLLGYKFVLSLPTNNYFDGYEYPLDKLVSNEKEAIHFSLSGHILDGYRNLYQEKTAIADMKIDQSYYDSYVSVLGIIKNIKQITTKKGSQMAFLSLEDETGELEGVIFPKDFEKIKNNYLKFVNLPVIFDGKLQHENKDGEDKFSLIISSIKIIDSPTKVYIHNNSNINKEFVEKLSSNNGISEVIVVDTQRTKIRILPFKINLEKSKVILKEYNIDYIIV